MSLQCHEQKYLVRFHVENYSFLCYIPKGKCSTKIHNMINPLYYKSAILASTQRAFTCSKSTTGVKYV